MNVARAGIGDGSRGKEIKGRSTPRREDDMVRVQRKTSPMCPGAAPPGESGR